MKDLKYFNTISDFNNVKYDFSTPTISYVEEDKNVRYNNYDNVNTYFSSRFYNSFLIVKDQSKLEYCKILDTDELLPLTGNGELRYATNETKLWHIEMKFKDEVTDLSYIFNAAPIWKVSEKIFSNCLNATNFTGVFQGCNNMTDVPENLFKYNTEVTNFGAAFNRVSMSSLPEKLFSSNTKVVSFSETFLNCAELINIPENIFKNNTSVTDFGDIFNSCFKLETVPANLFNNNTAVTSFQGAFQACSRLTGSMPTNLFQYNTAVTNFKNTFYYCSGLTGNVPVDSDGTPIYNRSGEGKPGYAIVSNSSGCFSNCTGLTDYDSIPSDWK